MKLKPLHRNFGVEVLGFDVLRSAAEEEIGELRAALDAHQLLLFRPRQRLTPDRQVEITSWFGPVADNGAGLCSVLHNQDEAGSRQLPFHQDFSYTDSPIKIISLQAIEIPPAGTTTAFVSGINAWATLSPDRQELLSSMTLRHRYVSQLMPDWPEFIADHPVRVLHPRTDSPVLFVTEYHAERIHELDPAESASVLAELFTHLYSTDGVYVHRWELDDLLIWDNLAVQHARPEQSDLARGTRAMQRVALNEVSFPELIERAREQQRHPQRAGAI